MANTKKQLSTVLVTGGAGFIGSHLVELLLEKHYRVVVLEHSKARLDRIASLAKQIKICFSDKGNLDKIFQDNSIDHIIHLSTKYLKTHEGTDDVVAMVDVNIKLPTLLCELAAAHSVKSFINTGTFFEYASKDTSIKEGDPTRAYNFYASSKLAFSEILKYYAYHQNFKVIDFRLFAPFGDRDNEKLMAFLVKVLNSGDRVDFSGGKQRWNFTYVKDIALAYLAALENFDKIKNYELFNVGYDKAISIKEIAGRLEKIARRKFNINWGAKPYAANEIFYANCDNRKLKKELRWQAQYGLDRGLQKTYRYFSEFYKKGTK
jgi:nucleoside-diphosphate-sugar epimerase